MRPSKSAAVVLTLFGLLFLVPGLFLLWAVITKSPHVTTSSPLAGYAIGFLIPAIGAGLIFAAISGYRKTQIQAAAQEANPTSPWLWKRDWASRRADSRNKSKEVLLWLLCIFVDMILLPISVSQLPDLISRSNPGALMLLAFDAAGLTLFAFAARASLRRERFGTTYFELDSLPFSPGGHLSGKIHLRLNTLPERGVDLSLSCIRKFTTGAGEDRTTTNVVLWQADKNVPASAIFTDPLGRAIPVEFAIPADAYVTDHDNTSDQVLWILHAQAHLPGIRYSDDFEVPVFRTSSSLQPAADSASTRFGFGNTSASSPADSECTISAPAIPRVVISSVPGGSEFYFPPFRNPGRALVLFVITLIWSAFAYFLIHSNAPRVFGVVFALANVFLIWGSLRLCFGSARICVGNGEITAARGTLGIGSTKRFAISDVESIVPATAGTQTGALNGTLYSIRLRTKSGKRVTLVDEIGSRQEARWIVAQIESLAGLQMNTRVEADAPLGAPAQPPQPVFGLPGRASRVGPGPSRVSTLLAFAVFVGLGVFMFALQVQRFSSSKSSANSRAHRPHTSANATTNIKRPVAPAASAKNMTEAEVSRILGLPAQAQAEELLERAIQHDPKALQLFEENVREWVGHIRLSDRMRDLEHRSEFSTDLRVRYANADINLTLDGWNKDEEAADMLIERAKTDAEYREAAVYFLGMLAGRGVAYDKIHPVLLDYAKHNPDAGVRQWAVEGMRYLGTNEALDELWESFTQDASMKVRERAGCNISDCGNFTRLQRMRMVPKFLELLGNTNLDSQMQNWCFMALREITDQNLPNDPQAWRTWYGRQGAAKLAEFERLDWWQVRGDE
jgi:hypothetical protein